MYKYVHYVQHTLAFVASEVEEVDEILWSEWQSAALWVIGCAGVVCVLPEKYVAVCAEVQSITVLLSVWVAAAQLEVHLLPFQMAFVREDKALTNLSICEVVLTEFLPEQPVLSEHSKLWTHLSQTDQVPAIRKTVHDSKLQAGGQVSEGHTT